MHGQTFESAADAKTAFAAFNDLSRRYAEKYGSVTRAEEIDGLADEAWMLWADRDEVTYHWRCGSLVVEAHVDCWNNCPDDVDAATRAWVDAIDAEAHT